MRTRNVIIGGIAGVLALAGVAGAGDTTLRPFTNPTTGSTPFRDCSSSGQLKGSGTKIQIQLKKLEGIADTDQVPCSGDEVICVQRTTNVVLGTSLATELVFRGEVKSGQVKIKHDVCKENSGLCPGIPAIGTVPTFAEDVLCYAADAAFNPNFGGYTLSTSCEGLVNGSQPTPASALIARTGTTSGCP